METLRQLQQYLPPFALDVFKLSFWLLLLMVVFVPLERLCGRHPQRVFRKAFLTDLGYYFLNSLLPKLILILHCQCSPWRCISLCPAGFMRGSRIRRCGSVLQR